MALTAREARLRYFFEKTQDSWWKLSKWPLWAQTLILLTHKSDSQMYNLMFLFLANGLPPEVARQWATAMDAHSGILTSGPYSQKEEQDILRVLIKHANGTLYTGKKKVMNMVSGRPEYM